MKGFIGAALALLPEMQAAKLAKPIHFALSYDEEIGCAGAPLMIADLVKRGVQPSGCIVGEPTSMADHRAQGHQRVPLLRARPRAHSSLTPKGLNAIEYAARLICHIRDIAERFRAEGRSTNCTTCRSPPRRRARSRAATRSTRCRPSAASTSNSATCRRSIPSRSSRASKRMHGTRCCRRCCASIRMPRSSSRRSPRRPASTPPSRPRSRSSCALTAGQAQGRVRHRGRFVRTRGHPERRVRWQHRAGAQAERICRAVQLAGCEQFLRKFIRSMSVDAH